MNEVRHAEDNILTCASAHRPSPNPQPLPSPDFRAEVKTPAFLVHFRDNLSQRLNFELSTRDNPYGDYGAYMSKVIE